MAKVTQNDIATILKVMNTFLKSDEGKAVLKEAAGGSESELKKLTSALGHLDADLNEGGYATTPKERKKINDEMLSLRKDNYNELYKTYRPRGQVMQNVVTPLTTSASRAIGNGYGIYSSALAALLANSAQGLNHSAVTDNLREGAASLAPIIAGRGAFGAMIGNTFADAIQTVADKYKADDEVANRQAFAASNPGTSGTLYYNLKEGTKNE